MKRRSVELRTAVFAGLLAVSAGCAGSLHYVVRGTPRVAGADADVTAAVNRDQANTRLEVHATNLPPPDRIQNNAQTFVVWQRRNGGSPWLRVGALQYNPGTRTGDMHDTTVPEVAFEMEITAENAPDVNSPSEAVIFVRPINR